VGLIAPDVPWATIETAGGPEHRATRPSRVTVAASSSMPRPSSKIVTLALSQTSAMTAGLQPVGAQNSVELHVVPQAPQARGSRVVSAHRVALQQVKSTGQAVVLQGSRHRPVEQRRPPAHSVSAMHDAQSCVIWQLPLAQVAAFLQPGTQVSCGVQYLPSGQTSFAPGSHSTQTWPVEQTPDVQSVFDLQPTWHRFELQY
jgi:hypothetical protein